jgi:hemoglobin
MEKPDIKERQDLELLVDSFYAKVRTDELLGPVFSHLDWPKHMPVMYNFWSSMMLGDRSYNGNPFQSHRQLPIAKEHFSQWLALFKQTVDEHFQGGKANEIKMRAESIAGVFQHKLGLLNPGGEK